MIKARDYKEYNVISLHTHLGGNNAELEIGSHKKKDDISFNLDSAQADLSKLILIDFKINAITNHNVLQVHEYLHLKKTIQIYCFYQELNVI